MRASITGATNAASLCNRSPTEPRAQEILASARPVLEAFAADPNNVARWSCTLLTELQGLGGLVQKAAQQASQLPDVVPASAIREGLQGLQGRNRPREISEIQQQLTDAWPDAEISVLKVCGTGCMAEVTEVMVMGGIDGVPQPICEICRGTLGFKCAAKTANPKQQKLFEVDFKLFANLRGLLHNVLRLVGLISKKSADELGAVVDKIQTMASNPELVSSVRNAFDMNVEMNHARKGADVLRIGGCNAFFVPAMYAASPTGDVLLMELLEGTLLEQMEAATIPSSFVGEFCNLYVKLLLRGFLHMDLHPANMIEGKNKIGLLDWGEVVEVPDEHLEDAQVLLKTAIADRWMGKESDALPKLFQRLGVKTKPGQNASEDNYKALANMLNIVSTLRGDPAVANATLINASIFAAPGWLEAWQKATNAVVISLQAAGATPEAVDAALKKAQAFRLRSTAKPEDGSGRSRSRSPRGGQM